MPESAPGSARHRESGRRGAAAAVRRLLGRIRRHAGSAQRRHLVVTVALTAAVIGSGGVVASSAFAATGPRVDVTWTTANSWTTGFQSAVTISNGTGTTLTPWQVRFDFPHALVSIWSAVSVASPAGTLSVGAPSWAQALAPGGSAQFGLTATRAGTAAIVPTSCTVVGQPAGVALPCSVNGGGSTPTPTATATATATPSSIPTPTPTPTTDPASGGLAITWTVTAEWTAGFQSSVRVANHSSRTFTPWQLSFTTTDDVVSLWDGTVATTSDGFSVTAPSYARTLAPGATATFGLTSAKAAGAPLVPTACRLVGAELPCSINGGPASPPAPTPTPAPTPSPTPTPTPGPGAPAPGASALVVAPYVDMGLWPTADLSSFAASAGVRAVTAAFIVADRSSACSPTWAGYTAYTIGGSDDFHADIQAFQAQGGRLIASFGGAANDELARVCTDPAKLLSAYSTVVTRFGLDRVDFDIEGADVSDSGSDMRRATAIAALQKLRAEAGHPLQVTLTLPVMPYGLLASGLRTISEFTAAGVQLSAVNLMTMDYGTGVTDMGAAATSAATAAAGQLTTIPAYASWTAPQRRGLIALTPMPGKNDTGEVFTAADASTVGRYAATNGLAGLSWWELTRDQPCAQGIPAYMCSGTAQPRWAYSRAFVAAAG